MFHIEGMIDYVTPGGASGWTSERHRSLAARVCLGNPKVTTLEKLGEMCKIINEIPEENLTKEEESLKKEGIIS